MRKNFGAKAMVYPMPVYIIGSYDENGVPNAISIPLYAEGISCAVCVP